MKNKIIKFSTALFILFFTVTAFADGDKTEKKPILKNKTTNPNYDPNKGLLGKPKEEKIIKRTRNEPILKNRKYEPKRMKKG